MSLQGLDQELFGAGAVGGNGKNLSVVCGRQSAKRINGTLYGLLCLDFEERFPHQKENFAEPYLKLGTLVHLTPRGFHVYLRVKLPEQPSWQPGMYPEEASRIANEDHRSLNMTAILGYIKAHGLDKMKYVDLIRFTGQYALVPPSVIHKKEYDPVLKREDWKPHRYSWINGHDVASGMTPIAILEDRTDQPLPTKPQKRKTEKPYAADDDLEGTRKTGIAS